MKDCSLSEPERFLARFIGLVRKEAEALARRLPASVTSDDLFQEGCVGLMVAHKRSVIQETKFEDTPHIVQRVRGAMIDSLRNNDRGSRMLRYEIGRIEKSIHILEQTLGRRPRSAEVASHLRMSPQRYQRIRVWARGLEAVSLFDHNDRICEELPCDVAIDPSLAVEQLDVLARLETAFNCLPEREKEILRSYYVDDCNLKQIAEKLSITEARVSQLKKRAIAHLHAAQSTND